MATRPNYVVMEFGPLLFVETLHVSNIYLLAFLQDSKVTFIDEFELKTKRLKPLWKHKMQINCVGCCVNEDRTLLGIYRLLSSPRTKHLPPLSFFFAFQAFALCGK